MNVDECVLMNAKDGKADDNYYTEGSCPIHSSPCSIVGLFPFPYPAPKLGILLQSSKSFAGGPSPLRSHPKGTRPPRQEGSLNPAEAANMPQPLGPKDASLFRQVVRHCENKHYKKGADFVSN
jgi:hypothetical protein